MIKISSDLVDKVCSEADSSARKRKNYNFHKEEKDTLQRMLNALNTGTYIRPHKHITPVKREAFIILKGKILYVEFSETGDINEWYILDYEKGNYGVEITPGTYHSIIALENNSVVYELKDGPYVQEVDKVFPDWAPEEGSKKGLKYIESIVDNCLNQS